MELSVSGAEKNVVMTHELLMLDCSLYHFNLHGSWCLPFIQYIILLMLRCGSEFKFGVYLSFFSLIFLLIIDS